MEIRAESSRVPFQQPTAFLRTYELQDEVDRNDTHICITRPSNSLTCNSCLLYIWRYASCMTVTQQSLNRNKDYVFPYFNFSSSFLMQVEYIHDFEKLVKKAAYASIITCDEALHPGNHSKPPRITSTPPIIYNLRGALVHAILYRFSLTCCRFSAHALALACIANLSKRCLFTPLSSLCCGRPICRYSFYSSCRCHR